MDSTTTATDINAARVTITEHRRRGGSLATADFWRVNLEPTPTGSILLHAERLDVTATAAFGQPLWRRHPLHISEHCTRSDAEAVALVAGLLTLEPRKVAR